MRQFHYNYKLNKLITDNLQIIFQNWKTKM